MGRWLSIKIAHAFVLALNLAIAKSLDLIIPSAVLTRAYRASE